MSLVSASVAVTGAPMFWPDAVFSATLRVVLVPSVKTGAELGSSTSVTLIVTLMLSAPPLPSETETVIA